MRELSRWGDSQEASLVIGELMEHMLRVLLRDKMQGNALNYLLYSL